MLGTKELTIELDEALLVGGVLAVGLLIFALRRYFAQKREMQRRIAESGAWFGGSVSGTETEAFFSDRHSPSTMRAHS